MIEKRKKITSNWYLTMIPNETVVEKNISPQNIDALESLGCEKISASVPGSLELDLFAAGLAPDPYYSQNAWKYQQYENRHLWYSTEFEWNDEIDGNTFLHFDGIDTASEIYLNGRLLGKTENMFISHEFSVNGIMINGVNKLLVHIIPATVYARQFELKPMNNAQPYNMASLPVRKAAYMYGWDIMPRFISGGIWKPVSVVQKPKERLEQLYLYTASINEGVAQLRAFFKIHTDRDDLSQLKVIIDGRCGKSAFHVEKRPWHTYENVSITVPDARLWFPKNAGEANLYDVTVRLERNGEICDSASMRFGIRTVELIRSSTTDADGKGEFVFKINGKRIFCMGTNWVPTDAFPSRHEKYLDRALNMVNDLGCNIIRCWGGNVYESEHFYDFCDQNGIMVWQDFCMGCGVYPQSDEFANKIYTEAVSVIKRLRSHPSVILFAGDNENDQAYSWNGYRRDPNFNRLTREILPAAVREYAVVTPFLPSSPYIDKEAFESGAPTSEEHLWGPRDYFKGSFYKNSVCHFASETGYHGCPSVQSLKEFIAPDKLWPVFDGSGIANDDWICHAAEMQSGTKGPYSYRIKLMANQIKTLFGTVPNNLNDFSKQSQISQAEAKKYFIERFRLSKWRRTGIIWWNLVDGWPQISDAVVDWYGRKKLAYNYIKRSQMPLCLMLDEPCNGMADLYAVNDLSYSQSFSYTVKNLTDGVSVISGCYTVGSDTSAKIASIPVTDKYSFLYIEWETTEGVKGSNHFITKSLDISAEQYLEDIRKIGYDTFEGF